MSSEPLPAGVEDSILLGAILVRQFGLTLADLQSALDDQREHGGRLGEVLVRRGDVSEETIKKALVYQQLERAKRGEP